MSGLGEDNYETLSTKTTQYSAKLLKKPDQCRAVARASYMFWSKAGDEPYRNPKRVLECLQRSLKARRAAPAPARAPPTDLATPCRCLRPCCSCPPSTDRCAQTSDRDAP